MISAQGAQQQQQKVEQARAQAESQENAKNSMLSQILDHKAMTRLSNLAIAKPDKAKMVEATIINMAERGQIAGKLSEDGFRQILDRISEQTQHKTTVHKAFSGKWNRYREMDGDRFLKEIRVREADNRMVSEPHLAFEIDGDECTMTSISTFKTHVTKFTLGVGFDDVTVDGRMITSTFTLEGDRLTHVDVGKFSGKDSRIERFILDNELVAVCSSGSVSSIRMYKRELE